MTQENKIAIVNSSSFGKIFDAHLDRLGKLGQVARFDFDSSIEGKELAEALEGYNIIIASVTPFFTSEFFEHKDELKLITRHGIGYNNVDLEAAKAHGTVVAIVPPLIERDAVAENNVTNLLALMRRTTESAAEVKNDGWENRAKFIGNGLCGKTVGVIGVGNTGSRVVEILHYGFRCEVLGVDPNKTELEINIFGGEKVALDELLERAEIICLCASLNDTNYHIISKDTISKMKDGVYLSNSARGALVDETAIIEAIQSGKLSGYATDVLEVEPGRSDHPFLAYPNIIMTPHTSAYTMECLEGMGDKCVSDCEAIVEGRMPQRVMQSVSPYITE
jgi:phosphoglycerate dehydrogenase-like enzyme